jgi:hypothetical protein
VAVGLLFGDKSVSVSVPKIGQKTCTNWIGRSCTASGAWRERERGGAGGREREGWREGEREREKEREGREEEGRGKRLSSHGGRQRELGRRLHALLMLLQPLSVLSVIFGGSPPPTNSDTGLHSTCGHGKRRSRCKDCKRRKAKLAAAGSQL